MDTYHVMLYVHLLGLVVGTSAGGLVGVCMFKLRAAQTVETAAPWGMLAGQTERVFPIAILTLFGSGAYMTSDVWTWGSGWIDVGIAGLVVLAVQGGGLAANRGHKVAEALRSNGPGELGPAARKMTRDRLLWAASFCNEGVVLGIIWDMTVKPGTASAIVAVVIGWAAGAAFAWTFTRAPAVDAATAAEPA